MAENEELESEGGTVLPLREMMSLVSADPADAIHSTLVPPEGAELEPASGEKLPLATLPVEPPDAAESS